MGIPGASFLSRHRHLFRQLLLALLLWPVLMIFPYAPDTSLDSSWQQVLIHGRAQGWQFGRDLIFTWGPWGYLHSIFHLGDTAATSRLVWEIAGKALLAAAFVASTRHLRPIRQALFVVVCLLALPVFQDTAYLLIITLLTLTVLLRPGVHRAELLAAVVGLAFLAQIKFTYGLLAATGIGLAVAWQACQRRWPVAAITGGGFGGAVVAWWMAAGQHPDNLVPYIRRSWEISTGYAAAMGLESTTSVLGCGVLVMASGGAYLWYLGRHHPDRLHASATTLFLCATGFLVWKHGFTRADGHVLGFFLFALPAIIAVPALCWPERQRPWFDLAVLPCLAGLWAFDPGLLPKLPGETLSRLRVNTRAAVHAGSLPAAWREDLTRARAGAALPTIRQAVGTERVDLYNYEQSYALLNGLNYAPRPVFQSYSAYTASLAWRNSRHYRSATAPAWLLWNHTSIDERFPTLDDADLIAELPLAFREVLTERDFILLRREKALPVQPPERRLLHRQSAALDEPVAVPAPPGCALWVQIFPAATKLGRLRSLFYKPAPVTLTVEEVTGRQTTWRLLPRIAEGGFLLHPFLETPADLSAYIRGRGRKQVRSLRISDPEGSGEYWKGAEVRFFALPEVPVQNEAAYLSLVENGLTNVAPRQVDSPVSMELFTLAGRPAALLHAPADMLFDLPADTTQVRASFGLRPGSYDAGGFTDGVEFSLEARWPDGRTAVLWQRLLSPVATAADRGTQSLHLTLPADRPGTLVFRTRPGAADRTEWDWSYWGDIRFSP